jgi:hypothetical protein
VPVAFRRGLVPVTAKLSRRFYETFGDEIANELVDWFNAVDATYRADLRELNELNFARFDAKVEQRFATFELKVEQRLAAMEWKIGGLKTELEGAKVALIKWMFGFWVGTVAVYFLARLL